MMLAVDISRSMLEDDMQIAGRQMSRLQAVKAVVGNFVEERVGDRLGLILFGQQGYLQTPLTFDNQTVKQQLQEALAGFAGNATAIGDAIGLAIKTLRDRPSESRVLILLTDGANTAGTEPAKAADVAAEAGIKIHTIGVGADSKIVRGVFGTTRKVNPSSDLDEASLINIAQKTGGRYFRARNPDELHQIYQELDRLEPIPEEQTFRPTQSLSYLGVLCALLISFFLLLVIRRGD
jgi:Ca-activated chloride channel family protein